MPEIQSHNHPLQSNRPLVVGVLSDVDSLQNWSALDKAAQSVQADVIELRLDSLITDDNPIPVLDQAAAWSLPLLITARDPAEGGIGNRTPTQRLQLVQQATSYAAIVDIELRSLPLYEPWLAGAQRQGVAIMGSFHDFDHTPADEVLEGAVALAEAKGLSAVKIATYLQTVDDLARLLRFVSSPRRIRVSAMGMGPLGPVSRLVLGRCGSILNYGYLGTTPNAPGQLRAADLKHMLSLL